MIERDEDTDWAALQEQNEKAHERAEAAAEAVGAPATLPLGKLGLLIVSPLTPEEALLERMEFRRQCLPLLKSPLQQIAADVKGLSPEHARIVLQAATELQAGHSGKGEPSEEMIFSRLYAPEGCAFRVWLMAKQAHPDLTLAAVKAEITEEGIVEVLANLWRAFKPPEVFDPETGKKKEPAIGASTSSPSGEPPGPACSAS